MKKKMTVAALSAMLLMAGCSNITGISSDKLNDKAVNLDSFAARLEENYYVQEGTYKEVDTLELASKGQLTSCFGNNQGSSYQVAFLPPAPEQNAAKGIAALNWADEEAGKFDDSAIENAPANPYFAPVGWSYKLREDEAIVLMLELPQECKYFSIGAYLMLTANDPTMDLSYDKYALTVKGSEESGNYNVIFGSLGDQLNNRNIASTALLDQKTDAFGSKAVIVMGGDKNTNEEMKSLLIESGIPSEIINVLEIPSQTLNLGLEKGADTFGILGRVSQPADSEANKQYMANLAQTSTLYRITPKVKDAVEEIPALKVVSRGTGEHEAAQLGYASKDLDQIRQSILDKYTAQGYTYTELMPHISVPDGITSIFNTLNGKGDNRDTSYLSTDYFTFNSDEDFVVIYGVNHTKTNKAIYSNAVLYGVEKLNGVTSVYDDQFIGSADAYLNNGSHDADNYYVYKLDRYGNEPYSAIVPKSTGNEDGKYYGLDDGADMLIAFRAYIEEATGVGPDYNEIVYDRAIVFHKPQ